MSPYEYVRDVTDAVQTRWNLEYTTALLYAISSYISRAIIGRDAPSIISGFRSPDRQRELYQDYLSGRLRHRPARQSWHTVGRAIDVDTTDGESLNILKFVWTYFGGRSGDEFSPPDPPHFDLPGPDLPPTIW